MLRGRDPSPPSPTPRFMLDCVGSDTWHRKGGGVLWLLPSGIPPRPGKPSWESPIMEVSGCWLWCCCCCWCCCWWSCCCCCWCCCSCLVSCSICWCCCCCCIRAMTAGLGDDDTWARGDSEDVSEVEPLELPVLARKDFMMVEVESTPLATGPPGGRNHNQVVIYARQHSQSCRASYNLSTVYLSIFPIEFSKDISIFDLIKTFDSNKRKRKFVWNHHF